MLAGKYPFDGDSDDQIYECIKKGVFSLSDNVFKQVSNETKDLLKELLETDPLARITASNALKHKAFNKIRKYLSSKNDSLLKRQGSQMIMDNLKNKIVKSGSKKEKKFHQAITTFITHNYLSKETALKYREIFKIIDANGDGRLTKDELVEGYKRIGCDILNEKKNVDSGKDGEEALRKNEVNNNNSLLNNSQTSVKDIDDILANIDRDNNGYIEVEEFIAAAIDLDELLNENNIEMAFESIDDDNSGKISLEELGKFIGGDDYDKELIKEVIIEAGKNPKNDINFEDFKDIMLNLKAEK